MSGSFFYMDLSKGKGGAFLGTQDFNKEHIQHWPALADAMIEIDPKPAGQVDILFPTA